MNTIIYYQAYRDRSAELISINRSEPKYLIDEDLILQRARDRENYKRMTRAVSIAEDLGIDENRVFVEAFDDTMAGNGHFMQLLRSNQPTIVVMDSMSMFLQQYGLTYWITLLRTALQNQVLPITVEEFRMGVHKDFDLALNARRTTIEALTEHLRPEPKRERGRRKLGPIADLVERILVHTASPESGAFREFRSSHDVLEFISTWYEVNTKSGESVLQHDRIFAADRWNTYKYKVRTMAKEELLDVLHQDYPETGIPKDIWQPSTVVEGQVVSMASLAAVKLLPEYGYQKVGFQWVKAQQPRQSLLPRPRQSVIGNRDDGEPTPQLDLDMP
jgi:hypothetical protein